MKEQYNALYSNKLNIDEHDYRTKSIFAIIFLGEKRNLIKSEKFEIKPYISGSIYPNIEVTDESKNKITNNGWIKCIWEFKTEVLEVLSCINIYFYTYSLRENIVYLYSPILCNNFRRF